MSRIMRKRGAVSIFVVIFTALLITIVTVSFTRLMLRDQQRATDNDLSQSAYDAALAGVEDAKRALTRYNGLPAGDSLRNLDLSRCNAITQLLTGGSTTADVQVGDISLQQAYTCVTVQQRTDDYIGALVPDQVQLVPLTTASTEQFNRIRIDWFSREDVSGAGAMDVPGSGSASTLSYNWPANRPSVLETQLIQADSSFTLSQFDNSTSTQSNTNTLFLYPKQLTVEPSTLAFINDRRRSPSNSPTDVRCIPNLGSSLYACTASIAVPAPIGGSASSRQNAYLRLTARYNGAHYRITLINRSGTADRIIPFDGVQPIVDSTGRANDLFRRVSARIETGAGVAYPNAAVDIHGNFCKTIRVTDNLANYSTGVCDPNQP